MRQFILFFAMLISGGVLAQPCSTSITGSGANNCVGQTLTAVPTGGTVSGFQWSRNNVNFSNDNPILAVLAGTYRVTVTFSDGCTAMAAVTLVIQPPTVLISGTQSCGTTGTATATTTNFGGSGQTYAWSNGTTTTTTTPTGASTITGLTAGTYTVTVTSSNGCSTVKSVDVLEGTPPTVSVLPATATLTCTLQSVLITASGGGSYSWPNGSNTATTTVSTPGIYTVTVTAANGCTATATAVVDEDQTPPAVNAGADITVDCTTPSTTLTAIGGNSFVWSNGATIASITVSPTTTTTYTVTATGINGCTAIDQVVVTVDNVLPVVSVTATSGGNCLTTLTATGGGSYMWNNNETTAVITVDTGAYTVTVTTANGCTTVANHSILFAQECAPICTLTPNPVSLFGEVTLTTTIAQDNFPVLIISPNGQVLRTLLMTGLVIIIPFDGLPAAAYVVTGPCGSHIVIVQ